MLKTLGCILLMVAAVGCANGPVVYPITVDTKGPVAVGDSILPATKVGRAKAQGIVLVGIGDASITAAAKDAGITKIHHVDTDVLNVLGIYSRYETIVYGE